jgi:microcystin-dependent protein
VFANGTNADGTQVNSNFNNVVNFLNTETVQRDASIAFTAIPTAPATDPVSDNQLARKAYVDNYTPAGVITQYGGASAPTGWLLCQGQAISRSNALYTRLFAAISTTYGAGDGSTTFNVPNLQGRIPVGRDSTQTEFDTLAEVGGSKITALITANLPSHQHGVGTILPNTIADHQHGVGTIGTDSIADHVHAHTLAIAGHTLVRGPVSGVGTSGYGLDYLNSLYSQTLTHTFSGSITAGGGHSHVMSGSAALGGGHTHTMSGSTALEGSGTSFNNLAPYIVVNYIIKL